MEVNTQTLAGVLRTEQEAMSVLKSDYHTHALRGWVCRDGMKKQKTTKQKYWMSSISVPLNTFKA